MKLSRSCLLPLPLLRATFGKALLGGLILLSSTFAWADLPTMEAPSRGEGSGLIDTIKNYAYDGGILLGLLIATLAFWVWPGIRSRSTPTCKTSARPGRTSAPWSASARYWWW